MRNLLLSWDKRGAEWVLVAYLSGDANMLKIVEEGRDAHSETGSLITGAPVALIQRERKIVGELSEPNQILELRRQHLPELLEARFLPRTMSIRQCGKKANHGLNYDEQFRTFALVNELEEREAKRIIHLYRNVAYPGIPKWYEATQRELRDNGRVLTDLLGNKCYFMENWGEDLFRQAYAFKPQSTVGRMVNRALSRAMDDAAPFMQPLELLSQVHDSIVAQYPITRDFGRYANWREMAQAAWQMHLHLSPEMHYSGRSFSLATDMKVGFNRAHMLDVRLTENLDELAESLRQAYEKLQPNKAAA